ncbi:unnamed protein product [Rotaria sp. Silwood2]|nr:unnamed protein product [Rotaria sp. Silwood2]
MYPEKYSSESSAPPPYNTDMQLNQQYCQSLPTYDTTSDERMANFKHIVDRYEINHTFATKLRALEGYEIVFICDDSGSMNTPLGNLFMNFFLI